MTRSSGFNGAAFGRTRTLTPLPSYLALPSRLQWGRVRSNAETDRVRRFAPPRTGFNGAAFGRTRKQAWNIEPYSGL